VQRFADAFAGHDVDSIVRLLTEDDWVKMPPMPFEYQGREAADGFFSAIAARGKRAWRFMPTRANGQLALAVYGEDPVASVWHANGLLVLALSGNQISEIIRFDASVLAGFGLPENASLSCCLDGLNWSTAARTSPGRARASTSTGITDAA
jgi:RNA polymerase sigma-70 factor (ECF subfamily)